MADDPEQVRGAGAGRGGSAGAVRDRGQGAAAQLEPQSLLLLPLLLLPAQLLADAGPALAGAAGRALHEAAGVHGLSRLPRAALALRDVRAAEILSRLPFLARP